MKQALAGKQIYQLDVAKNAHTEQMTLKDGIIGIGIVCFLIISLIIACIGIIGMSTGNVRATASMVNMLICFYGALICLMLPQALRFTRKTFFEQLEIKRKAAFYHNTSLLADYQIEPAQDEMIPLRKLSWGDRRISIPYLLTCLLLGCMGASGLLMPGDAPWASLLPALLGFTGALLICIFSWKHTPWLRYSASRMDALEMSLRQPMRTIQDRSIRFDEARLFVTYLGPQTWFGQERFYELASQHASIVWRMVEPHEWLSWRYSFPNGYDSYQREMRALFAMIRAKSGLMLYDLDKQLIPMEEYQLPGSAPIRYLPAEPDRPALTRVFPREGSVSKRAVPEEGASHVIPAGPIYLPEEPDHSAIIPGVSYFEPIPEEEVPYPITLPPPLYPFHQLPPASPSQQPITFYGGFEDRSQ